MRGRDGSKRVRGAGNDNTGCVVDCCCGLCGQCCVVEDDEAALGWYRGGGERVLAFEVGGM